MGCAAPNPLHWVDLRSRSSEEVLRHEGTALLSDDTGYELSFLNAKYRIDVENEIITEISPKPDRELSELIQVLLINYLIARYGGPLSGKEVSEKDLTGGPTFFQGPHALHVQPIIKLFGRDPEGFEALALKLGAVSGDVGDKSMKFFPFPLIPVTYGLWVEDDEFPASVSVLFDSSISRWFELDMVFSIVYALTERIMEEIL